MSDKIYPYREQKTECKDKFFFNLASELNDIENDMVELENQVINNFNGKKNDKK